MKPFVSFLMKAKKQAYASSSAKPVLIDGGGKTYSISSAEFLYTDTYFGNIIDSGQERLYYKGKVIWTMAYRGGMISHHELHAEAFDFLKKCISKIPKSFPARGPRNMKIGDFRYENKWKGNILGFVGEENIYFKGEKICFRNYLGGLIKNEMRDI